MAITGIGINTTTAATITTSANYPTFPLEAVFLSFQLQLWALQAETSVYLIDARCARSGNAWLGCCYCSCKFYGHYDDDRL